MMPPFKPITEVIMGPMERQYVSRVTYYLEHLGCRISPLSDSQGYHIYLPEGSMEEVILWKSTQWKYQTIINLPGGQKLSKYILTSFNPSRQSIVMLAFPISVLEGPEPPL